MAEITSAQNLLAANCGDRRVTIGLDPSEELRRLSDARSLTCPGCNGAVVLHAGAVRAHHFAHLPGAICLRPQTEPETEEHRAGKLLLARWLRARVPDAGVQIEAWLPETQQRADLMLIVQHPPQRVAIEFQCAHLTAREWHRRHRLYRASGIADLWILGGSRLIRTPAEPGGSVTLRTSELERTLLRDGAPLLFLDPCGENLSTGTVARFRPDADTQPTRPTGRLSVRPLLELSFPWALLDWAAHADSATPEMRTATRPGTGDLQPQDGAFQLTQWLAQRYRVTPATLDPFFGLPVKGADLFACDPKLWQAAIYYRFVHGRVGEGWWLREVISFARAYLPVPGTVSSRRLDAALAAYQELLAAAGLLSLPMGYARASATVTADLTTIDHALDREEILRLARYRRTLSRERAR